MTTRRDFLMTTAGASAALLLGNRAFALPPEFRGRAAKPLDLLILGGTGYLGPYQVRDAIARGHRVTVFNRGKRQADLPASVIHLQGDRSIEKLDLEALKGKKWDAAIDNGQDPAWVTKTADLLKDSVKYYLFVSSTGVYFPYPPVPDLKETDKVPLVSDGSSSANYGVNKALSEIENTKFFGNRAINIRPNYILGPEDTSPRLNVWIVRYARGGEILVPGNPDDKVSCADVRDHAAFMIHCIEEGKTGTFNAGGPPKMTMKSFQDDLAKAIPGKYTTTWIADPAFLRAHRVGAMVPWVPTRRTEKGEPYGQANINSDKAIAAGFKFRPMTETVRDTVAWWQALPADRRDAMVAKFPLSPEAEADALKAWKEAGK